MNSMTSFVSSTNDREYSANNEPSSLGLIEKIQVLQTYMNVVQSRVTLLEATIQNENASRRSLSQGAFDVTHINNKSKDKFNKLWSTILSLYLRDYGLKLLVLTSISRPLLSDRRVFQPDLQQSFHGDTFITDIVTAGTQLALTSSELKTVCYDQKKTEIEFENQQLWALQLIAEKEKTKSNRESEEDKYLAKYTPKAAKIKIGRAIMNCLLSKFNVDFEEHPELLDIKKKLRKPFHY